jgi:hypothetical protein
MERITTNFLNAQLRDLDVDEGKKLESPLDCGLFL